MEGELPRTRMKISETIGIIHILDESGKYFAIFCLKVVGCVTLLQDGVPVPRHDRELVPSLDDVGEQLVEEVPPLPPFARPGGGVHVDEYLASTFY